MADKHFLDYDGLSQFFNGLKQKFYQKPSSGIPKSDLASSVRESLDKADNALPKSGGTMTGAINMGATSVTRKKITMLADPTVDYDAANKKYVDDAIKDIGTELKDGSVTTAKIAYMAVKEDKIATGAVTMTKIADGAVTKSKLSSSVQNSLTKADDALPKTGGDMSGNIGMLGHSITGLPAPQVDSDAVNKKYVDDSVDKLYGNIITFSTEGDPLFPYVASKDFSNIVEDFQINRYAQFAFYEGVIYQLDHLQDNTAVFYSSPRMVNDAVTYYTCNIFYSDYFEYTTASFTYTQIATPELSAYRKASEQDIIDAKKLNKSGGTMTGDINMGTTSATRKKITMLADPTADYDAVNKKYVDDAIEDIDTELDDGEVTTAKIYDRAVTEDKIATGAVTMTKIENGAVHSGQIAAAAVTNAKIADTAVTTAKIDTSAVTTEKIAGGAVTEDKIANAAVTENKIKIGAVTTTKIANGAVVKASLSSSVQDSLNKADNALLKIGGQMFGDIVMLGNSITGLPAPQVDSDAATKAYVDSHVAEEINIIHITGNDPDPYGSSNYWICDVKNSDVRNLLDSGILLAEVYDGSIAEVYDASMPQIQLFSTKPTYNIIWTLTDTPATIFDVSGYEVTRTISPVDGHTHNNKAVLDNITQAKVDEWNAKYSKPSGGIPKADLANDVQVSLGKADTALQTHQSLAAYRTSAQQDAIDGEKQNKSTLEADVAAKGFTKTHRYEITSLYEDNTLWIDYFEFGGTFQYSDLLNIFNNGLLYSIRVEDPESGSYTYLILDYSDVYGQIYGHFFVGATMRFFKAKEEGIRET